MRALALLLLATPLLASCGLRPLYSGGTSGPVASLLATVEVDQLPGQNGWLMSNALRDRLAASGKAAPAYRLEVELDDQIVGLGVRADDSIARQRRTLRARYRLIEMAKGTVVLDATAGSDAGIDSVGSEYATIAAENSALERLTDVVADQIVARLALYAERTGAERTEQQP